MKKNTTHYRTTGIAMGQVEEVYQAASERYDDLLRQAEEYRQTQAATSQDSSTVQRPQPARHPLLRLLSWILA